VHGTDYIQWKCRYCCSLSTYECFGPGQNANTQNLTLISLGYLHVCENCHPVPPLGDLMDFNRSVNGQYPNKKKMHEYHQCPVYTG
jgi:hypothetical protein